MHTAQKTKYIQTVSFSCMTDHFGHINCINTHKPDSLSEAL